MIPGKRKIGAMGGYAILIALDDSRIRCGAKNPRQAAGRFSLLAGFGREGQRENVHKPVLFFVRD